MELLGMDSQESSSHKDLRPYNITQSKTKEVKKVTRAIQNFMNLFETDSKEVLYRLSSGAPFPSVVDKVGKEARTAFVKERWVENTKSFPDPIKSKTLRHFQK